MDNLSWMTTAVFQKNYAEKKELVIKETETWSEAREAQRVNFRWSVSSLVRSKQEESSLVWNWPPGEFEWSAQISAIKAFYVTGKILPQQYSLEAFALEKKSKKTKSKSLGPDGMAIGTSTVHTLWACLFVSLDPFPHFSHSARTYWGLYATFIHSVRLSV